jgi:hypothetical protein
MGVNRKDDAKWLFQKSTLHAAQKVYMYSEKALAPEGDPRRLNLQDGIRRPSQEGTEPIRVSLGWIGLAENAETTMAVALKWKS